MVATVNASTSAGVIVTSDTSGALALQTAGTTALTISSAQAVSLTNALPVASGGTGLTTVPHTVQVFTSGSGTYTTPANCKAIFIYHLNYHFGFSIFLLMFIFLFHLKILLPSQCFLKFEFLLLFIPWPLFLMIIFTRNY